MWEKSVSCSLLMNSNFFYLQELRSERMPKYPGKMNLGSHHEIFIVTNSLEASFGYTPVIEKSCQWKVMLWFEKQDILGIYFWEVTIFLIPFSPTCTCTVKYGMTIWAATWQNQQTDCAPSEDSDQPGHLPRLIWVFARRTLTLLVLSWDGSFHLCHKPMKWEHLYVCFWMSFKNLIHLTVLQKMNNEISLSHIYSKNAPLLW